MLLNEVMLETFQGDILCDINFVPEPAKHQGSIPAPVHQTVKSILGCVA